MVKFDDKIHITSLIIMSFPEYISLIWKNKKDCKVIFSNKALLKSKYYINKVHLKNIDKSVYIYGKINDNYCIVSNVANTKKIRVISLLKSNIQKAVRLGKINEALISSFNLIKLDFISFIRRLIIISIEDVALLESFPVLVWFMMSYPNFELTNEIIQYLLLNVYTLCVFKKKYIPNSNIYSLDYEKYNYKDKYLNSLIIASEYGGFKGDVKLFNRYINSTDKLIIPLQIKNLVIQRSITKNDIITSAIDFHCYPFILEKLSEMTDLNIDTLKRLIWINSSSINYRETHKYIDIKVWKKINKIYQKLQCEILKKIYVS